MTLLTDSVREALLRNGRPRQLFRERGGAEPDFLRVVKLFTPDRTLHLALEWSLTPRTRISP
jgi:hypothetical protein